MAENIFLGRQYKTKYGTLDKKRTMEEAEKLLESISPDIPADAKVMELPVWQQQVVEIVKAMSFQPEVLILDEPTSALAQNETDKLFEVIKRLREKDVAILYISHRLQELSIIADTVTVLRDGKFIGSAPKEELSSADIVKLMFGKVEIAQGFNESPVSEKVILEVKDFTRDPYYEDVSFKLRQGEILGIAGMLGSGRSELVRSIFGADPSGQGEVILFGEKVKKRNPRIMKNKGLGFLPEDRKREGLILSMSCRENLLMTSLKRITRMGVISKKVEKELVEQQINALLIKLADAENPASSLSGGNQQKIVVGNWLNANPRIIVFDEPTKGIDIKAKQQIFHIIKELSEKGISTIFISSELEELPGVCHRILIMKRGRISGEVCPKDISAESLYSICMGESYE